MLDMMSSDLCRPRGLRELRGLRGGAGRAFALVGLLLVAVGAPRARAEGGEVVVFEAASLKDVFARLALRFEKEHAGAKVVTNAAGSQELRTQLEHGAAADVFASADRKHMDALAAQGLVGPSVVFACNEPVIVVRPALAATVKSLADLPRVERLVVGTPEVPIGAYALKLLQKAAARYGADFPRRVDARVASRELNVRQVLAKVVLGEADAGVVYRSDAMAAAGKVAVVAIPADLNVTAEYPIAVLKKAPNARLAAQWLDLVRSDAGVAALREAGFVACPKP
jgi:molybdate transport system substrate-binding protein